MQKTDSQIYEEFAAQLCEWSESGTAPSVGNQDIRYSLTLQKDRLTRYHTKIEYQLVPRMERQSQVNSAVFTDEHYTNRLVWKAYDKTAVYSIEDERCLTLNDRELLYTIITRLNDDQAKASSACPNCGAVSEVSVLLDGCPFCHTRFLISDLFPRISNFYFLRDYGLSEREAKSDTAKWMTAGAIAGFLIRIPGFIVDIVHGENLFLLLITILLAAGVGSVFGYFALSLKLLSRVMKDAFKQAPRAAGQITAKKKLTDFMKQQDPGFSFEYFFGKVQSLLKILIFSDDRTRLAVYDGPADDCMLESFNNIIDSQFDGAISFNSGRVEGNYCYLDLNVYMTDVYCQGNRLVRKSDSFQIGLCRNISKPVDFGFTIKRVNCKSCGASFDAAKEKLCPYCKSQYALREDDWVITFVRKQA